MEKSNVGAEAANPTYVRIRKKAETIDPEFVHATKEVIDDQEKKLKEAQEENARLKKLLDEARSEKAKPKQKIATTDVTKKMESLAVVTRKRPLYEKKIQETIWLSPWHKKLLIDRSEKAKEEFQAHCAREVDEARRRALLCPAPFKNDKQCPEPKRPPSVDPDTYCAKCRKRLGKLSEFERPTKARKLSTESVFKVEDFIDDEAEEMMSKFPELDLG